MLEVSDDSSFQLMRALGTHCKLADGPNEGSPLHLAVCTRQMMRLST